MTDTDPSPAETPTPKNGIVISALTKYNRTCYMRYVGLVDGSVLWKSFVSDRQDGLSHLLYFDTIVVSNALGTSARGEVWLCLYNIKVAISPPWCDFNVSASIPPVVLAGVGLMAWAAVRFAASG